MNSPFLSVIVPAYNGAKVLPQTLEALAASDLPRDCWELIVVDDASTDDTAEVAAPWADSIVRLPGRPHGPAYARNRGFEAIMGDVVVFVDADVCVHPDTLSRIAWTFAKEPDVGAVFGSYDTLPPGRGLVSQYRNLLHHYVHHRNAGEAETFWAGCGAVRSSVFSEVGRFDEWHYVRPQIEDIELGHRIREHGHRILLQPEIQGTHLKQWNFRNVITTDFRDRGVPWTRLLVQQGNRNRSKALNLRTVEKVKVALIWLALLGLLVSIILRDPLYAGATVICLAAVIWLSRDLYGFFRRERGTGFMLRSIPIHLFYYLLNGISAIWGFLLHHLVGEPAPPPEIQAFSEVGMKKWPPIPRRAKGSPWHR